MTGERVKRFPLELADLVREPRRRDERPGDARAAAAGAGKNGVSKTGMGKTGARGVSSAAPSALSALSAKPAPAGSMPQKPASSSPMNQPGRVRPAGVGIVGAARHDGRTGAVRAALARNEPAQTPLPRSSAAPSSGAPGVALNGTLALTSERVRERMVERLRANGIADTRVLQALATVPRHMFVDPGLATQAYEDAALPIGHHQTISKPSVVARMLELVLAGRGLSCVLEIGTGCGYQAAVLSRIARDVYSIERIRPLYERAKTNLRPLRIPNIRLHYGDGRLGLPSAAPFDAIVIAAAGFDVPQALLEQLAIGGRLVAPVAAGTDAAGEATQVLTLVERTGPAQWRESRLDRVFFVPLKSGVI